MQLTLRAFHCAHTTIHNLSFPCTAIIAPTAGSIRCTHRSHSRLVHPKQQVRLRPFTPIMIDIANDAAASIEIHPNDLCSDSDATGTAMRPLTRLLAHHVLGAPQRNWTLDAFASVAGMTRPALSRRLFAEGTSFRESVRTHRLTRLLIDLSDCSLPAHTLSLRYGFADRCLLEDAVFEQYGLSLSRLKNIVGHTAPQRLLGTQEELPDLRRCVPALWQT